MGVTDAENTESVTNRRGAGKDVSYPPDGTRHNDRSNTGGSFKKTGGPRQGLELRKGEQEGGGTAVQNREQGWGS